MLISNYYNSAPPFFGWVWKWINTLIPGPAGMLMLQLSMFAVGIALLVGQAIRNYLIASLLVLVIELFPLSIYVMGRVQKDAQLVGALALASGLLILAQGSRSWWALIGAVHCLFWACALRYNSFFAVLPLCIWAGWISKQLCITTATRAGRKHGVLRGIGLFLFICLACKYTWQTLVQSPLVLFHYLLAYDIASISIDAKKNYFTQTVPGTNDLTISQLQLLHNNNDGQELFVRAAKGPASFVPPFHLQAMIDDPEPL
jgi:hypothetical protein